MELWSQLKAALGQELSQKDAEQFTIQSILGKCWNLETLKLQGSIFRFPLTDQKGVPSHFLTQSLKRLFLEGSEDPERMMKAQNVIWILVFCVHLRQASLSFILTLDGYNFLLEYSETFGGLSEVKQLAFPPSII